MQLNLTFFRKKYPSKFLPQRRKGGISAELDKNTFGELIEIQIVNCLSGCCKILLYPYFAILALDMASPIKILFNFACYQRKRGSFDNT